MLIYNKIIKKVLGGGYNYLLICTPTPQMERGGRYLLSNSSGDFYG